MGMNLDGDLSADGMRLFEQDDEKEGLGFTAPLPSTSHPEDHCGPPPSSSRVPSAIASSSPLPPVVPLVFKGLETQH